MKRNVWLGISLALLLVVVLFVGYYLGNSHNIGTTLPTNTSEVNSTSTVSSQSNNLDLQAQCASQAQKTLVGFEQDMGTSYAGYAQQDHYDQSLNKCFVLISYGQNFGNQTHLTSEQLNLPVNIETLLDAYENSDLADCSYYLNRLGIDMSNPDSYTSCSIGGANAVKVDYQQYKDFISQRMALSQ